jgi:hypothetical protein
MPTHRCTRSAGEQDGTGRGRACGRQARPSAMRLLASLPSPSSALPATAWAVDPTGPAPLFGAPSFFSLTVTSKVSGGAKVRTKLTAAHHLGLFVGRDVGGNAEQPLALVPLGLQTAGPHQIRWNLMVDHKRLTTGTMRFSWRS